jgi:hypothetical protein
MGLTSCNPLAKILIVTSNLRHNMLDGLTDALIPPWATHHNPIVRRERHIQGKQLRHMLAVVIELIVIQALLLAVVPVRFSLLAALPFSIAAAVVVPYALYTYAESLLTVIHDLTQWVSLQRRYGPLDMLRLTCVPLRDVLLGLMTAALVTRLHELYRVGVITTIMGVPVVAVMASVQALMPLPPRWLLLIVLVALPIKLMTDTLMAGVVALWLGTLFPSPTMALAGTMGLVALYAAVTGAVFMVPDWGFRLVFGVLVPVGVGGAVLRWLPGLLVRYVEATA